MRNCEFCGQPFEADNFSLEVYCPEHRNPGDEPIVARKYPLTEAEKDAKKDYSIPATQLATTEANCSRCNVPIVHRRKNQLYCAECRAHINHLKKAAYDVSQQIYAVRKSGYVRTTGSEGQPLYIPLLDLRQPVTDEAILTLLGVHLPLDLIYEPSAFKYEGIKPLGVRCPKCNTKLEKRKSLWECPRDRIFYYIGRTPRPRKIGLETKRSREREEAALSKLNWHKGSVDAPWENPTGGSTVGSSIPRREFFKCDNPVCLYEGLFEHGSTAMATDSGWYCPKCGFKLGSMSTLRKVFPNRLRDYKKWWNSSQDTIAPAISSGRAWAAIVIPTDNPYLS